MKRLNMIWTKEMTKEICSWIHDDNASSLGATLKRFLEVKEYFKSGNRIIYEEKEIQNFNQFIILIIKKLPRSDYFLKEIEKESYKN